MKCGPLMSHFSRLPSEVRMKAPLRVPTRSLTLLIFLCPFVVMAGAQIVEALPSCGLLYLVIPTHQIRFHSLQPFRQKRTLRVQVRQFERFSEEAGGSLITV